MSKKRKDTHLGFTALMIGGLLFSLLLVLILDGARWIAPKESIRMQAEFLLEDMDGTAAQALASEQFLTPGGGKACRLIRIESVDPQKKQCLTADGRILLLPSESRFCAHIVLELSGHEGEDGFLAFGSLPLRPGARMQLVGARMMGEGLLISLSPL